MLQEHRALALKRTGLGIVLDSDKPHLVGIDEDVLSTGITLYHLKEGDTVIGTEETKPDIALRGPCIEPSHCVINLKNGVATLVPSAEGALCMVNASSVAEPTRLSQGCVIVLGKTNMFRYNDPTEAANLRQQNRANGGANGINNKNHSAILANQSLLSQGGISAPLLLILSMISYSDDTYSLKMRDLEIAPVGLVADSCHLLSATKPTGAISRPVH